MSRSTALLSAVLVAVGWHIPATVSAYTGAIELEPVRDNTLYENALGSVSNGKGLHFFAGRTGQFENSIRRGLVAFDVGIIPPGSMIDSVAVTLHVSRAAFQAVPEQVSLHLAQASWGEGESLALGEEGQGAPAQPGDATWRHRFFDTAFWATLGGDFDTQPSATTVVGITGFHTWSSSSLASNVQAWLDDPGTNFGWVVIGNEGAASTSRRFDSKDHDSTDVRPRLFVQFTTPTDALPPRTTFAVRLHANHPNPFNPGTRISYELPHATPVRMRVYDVHGRLVRTLVDAYQGPGRHTVGWDGRDRRGANLSSGIYVYQLTAGGATLARRMLMMK